MMVARPEQWVKPMAVAGANQYTFHLEAADNPGALIKDIRENGMKVRGASARSGARGSDERPGCPGPGSEKPAAATSGGQRVARAALMLLVREAGLRF